MVLFVLTSAINVITLVLAGVGLYTGLLFGPQEPLLSIVPAAVGAVVFTFALALRCIVQRLAASPKVVSSDVASGSVFWRPEFDRGGAIVPHTAKQRIAT